MKKPKKVLLCEQCGKEGGRKRMGRPFVVCVVCENKLRAEIERWYTEERYRQNRLRGGKK